MHNVSQHKTWCRLGTPGCQCVRILGKQSDQKAFFDVRVFNPTAPSYRNTAASSLYKRFECNMNKQRKYEQRVRDVEMGSFTPLVFSTFGGMATTAYCTRGWHLCLLIRETRVIVV